MANEILKLKQDKHQRCIYPGCSDKAKRRGFCTRHYQSFKRREDAFRRYNERHRMAGKADEIAALYIIGSHEMEPIKVGMSNNPIYRLEQMQCGCPYQMFVFGALYARRDAIVALEYETHKALTDIGFHVRGEWFEADPDDALLVAKKCADMFDIKVWEPQNFRQNELETFYKPWTTECINAGNVIRKVEGHIMLSRGQKYELDRVSKAL